MFNIYKYTVNNQIGDTTHFFQVLVLEIVHIISFIDNKRTHEGLSNGSKKNISNNFLQGTVCFEDEIAPFITFLDRILVKSALDIRISTCTRVVISCQFRLKGQKLLKRTTLFIPI